MLPTAANILGPVAIDDHDYLPPTAIDNLRLLNNETWLANMTVSKILLEIFEDARMGSWEE
jgi:hypothetical protein